MISSSGFAINASQVGLLPMVAWHPISGCSPISKGCANCVAASPNPLNAGLITGKHFNGKVRFNETELHRFSFVPAAKIHVCPSGDLFHEAAPQEWIDLVFEEMEYRKQHTYTILTKRPARMQDYLNKRYVEEMLPRQISVGVSVEDQESADARIPHLLRVPSDRRFISVYPMLGLVRLTQYLASGGISYVNAGEEYCRPADPSWFTEVAADCVEAGVPFEHAGLIPAFYNLRDRPEV